MAFAPEKIFYRVNFPKGGSFSIELAYHEALPKSFGFLNDCIWDFLIELFRVQSVRRATFRQFSRTILSSLRPGKWWFKVNGRFDC